MRMMMIYVLSVNTGRQQLTTTNVVPNTYSRYLKYILFASDENRMTIMIITCRSLNEYKVLF